jgi:hypothetical protein
LWQMRQRDIVVAFYDIQMWRTGHNRGQSGVAITVSALQELRPAVQTQTSIWDSDVTLFCCHASLSLSSTVSLTPLSISLVLLCSILLLLLLILFSVSNLFVFFCYSFSV